MPLARYGLGSTPEEEGATPSVDSETASALARWPFTSPSPAPRLPSHSSSLDTITEQGNIQVGSPRSTQARGLSARSSFSIITTRSSTPRRSSDWFAQLPPKVQRAQFSPEEQAYIQDDTVIETPTTQSMSRISPSKPRLRESASASADSSSSATRSNSIVPTLSHELVSDAAASSTVIRKPSTSASHFTTRPPPTGGFMTSPRRSVDISRPSLSLRRRRPSTSDMFASPPPSSRKTAPQYLHDPETQMKLELYFGSEEGFDEVLVHGFPCTDERETTDNAPKLTRRRSNSRARMTAISDYQKALKHDSLAFLDDSEDEDEYYSEEDEEQTESDGSQDDSEQVAYCYDLPRKSRSISNLFPDYENSSLNESPSPHRPSSTPRFLGLDRDSTLRITLTRPETHAAHVQDEIDSLNEEVMTALPVARNPTCINHPRPDLLALEPLEILPDHTAIALLSKQSTRSLSQRRKSKGRKSWIEKMKPAGGSPWSCM